MYPWAWIKRSTQVVRIADIGQVPIQFSSSLRFFGPPDFSLPRLDRIQKKAARGIQFVNRAENFANSQPKFVPSGSLTLSPLPAISSGFDLRFRIILFLSYKGRYEFVGMVRFCFILFYFLLILELKSCWGNCIFILSKLQQIFSYKIHDLA